MRCAMASERKALQRRRAILLRRSTTRPQRTQGLHPLVLQAHALQLHAGGDGRKLDQVHPAAVCRQRRGRQHSGLEQVHSAVCITSPSFVPCSLRRRVG